MTGFRVGLGMAFHMSGLSGSLDNLFTPECPVRVEDGVEQRDPAL